MSAVFRLAALIAAILVFSPSPAHAASGEWARDEMASARLVSDLDGTGAAGGSSEIILGIEIALDEGWHTYWRSPGDAGIPPRVEWKGLGDKEASNVAKAELLFPAPTRYSVMGMETIGYSKHVLFPVKAELMEAGKPARIKAAVEILVCGTLCLPKRFDLELALPSGNSAHGAEAAALSEALAKVPSAAANGEDSISIDAIEAESDGVKVSLSSRRPFAAPDMFIETAAGLAFAKPEAAIAADGTSAVLTAKLSSPLPEGVTLATQPIMVTVTDSGRAAEKTSASATAHSPHQSTTAATPENSDAVAGGWKLLLMAFLAVVGGFILNLMPCVLPVLSLKVLGALRHGGGHKSDIRKSFLLTAAGIEFSFLVLAMSAIALKNAGAAVGWGAQFQQPVFLAFLIVVLVAFACNLWGLFEISLPHRLANRLGNERGGGFAGDFLTGAFATLLATPCSAPFLGASVGWAMAAGQTEIIVVFAALGVGMSLPYLAVAAHPKLHGILPKPGAWMMTVRRLLGVALAATALWLAWVLAMETSAAAGLATAACMAALTGGFMLRRNAHGNGHRRGKRMAFAIISAMAVLPFVVAAYASPAGVQQASSRGEIWQPFDEAAISRLVGEGKTVFVDVTADWCLTCKVNKKIGLSGDEVTSALFDSPDVVAMQADWTRQDAAIAEFLKKHGRYGIPFNAVFGPKAPEGLILPELLTRGIVLDGLEKARK